MILAFFGCFMSPPSNFKETNTFSPALHQIVLRLRYRYGEDCNGIEAYWNTSLPEGTLVQAVAGPKIEKSHFDEDAIQDQKVRIDDMGRAHLPLSTVKYDHRENFLNLRVWGSHSSILYMLKRSQKKGGFPIATGPNGPYGWAEATIPPCQLKSSPPTP